MSDRSKFVVEVFSEPEQVMRVVVSEPPEEWVTLALSNGSTITVRKLVLDEWRVKYGEAKP